MVSVSIVGYMRALGAPQRIIKPPDDYINPTRQAYSNEQMTGSKTRAFRERIRQQMPPISQLGQRVGLRNSWVCMLFDTWLLKVGAYCVDRRSR